MTAVLRRRCRTGRRASCSVTVLRQVEVRAQTLPGNYAAAALRLLFMLDKLPRTRATLEEHVARAFEGSERLADRQALLAAVAALTERVGFVQQSADRGAPQPTCRA